MIKYKIHNNKIKECSKFLFFDFYKTIKEFDNNEIASLVLKELNIKYHIENIKNNVNDDSIITLLEYYGFINSDKNVWLLQEDYKLIRINYNLHTDSLTNNEYYSLFYECYVFYEQWIDRKERTKIHHLPNRSLVMLDDALFKFAEEDGINTIVKKYNDVKDYILSENPRFGKLVNDNIPFEKYISNKLQEFKTTDSLIETDEKR